MVFSSPIFLFGFLPIALAFYFLSPSKMKNITLLVFSLLFYAWGEVFYLFLMLLSIGMNYSFGLLIEKQQLNPKRSKLYVSLGVCCNIALLISYKYANFITDNINILLDKFSVSAIDLSPVHLPLGISFFTFQAISYIVDVYRREVQAQRNVYNLALYIALFPQLIAGPIVRYHDVAKQIVHRKHSLTLVASGIQRFTYGLAKKMLIANPLGEVANSIFALSNDELTLPLAWVGILAYTLQIFFDFSGYSDMAIGLGRIFGFTFLENFNYPYIAKSIREFWRRWHISLSTWFRDYVYIPLGGSRVSTFRVYLNLLIVFIITGFWHGASWNFLIWGLFHGVFLASEHANLLRVGNLWRPLQHLYVLLVVIIGWVFFRVETLPEAIAFIQTMFDFTRLSTPSIYYFQAVSNEAFYAFIVALLLCVPIYPFMQKKLVIYKNSTSIRAIFAAELSKLLLVSSLLALCLLKLSSSTYNPFIYFRF